MARITSEQAGTSALELPNMSISDKSTETQSHATATGLSYPHAPQCGVLEVAGSTKKFKFWIASENDNTKPAASWLRY